MPTLSEKDHGKQVVNQNGDEIGIVSSVQGDRVFIKSNPGALDKIKSKFGWENLSDDDYAVRETDIEAVTDDEVRLNR